MKSKVIWLFLYAKTESRDDYDWVTKNIVDWTHAVSAANADPLGNSAASAALGAVEVFAFYTLGGGLVIAILGFGYKKLTASNTKQDDTPESTAYREGALAFRNDLREEANPYSSGDEQLAQSWLSGYREAEARRTPIVAGE